MKILMNSILALTLGLGAFANARSMRPTPEMQARDAFAASAEVGESIVELQAAGYKKIGETSLMVIGGGCGFAGCDTTFLVGVTLSTDGANTQTTSVLAVVEVKAVGDRPTVRLATVK
jgi:hypothetical protein